MFKGPEPVRSQSDHDDIRIIKNYTTEDGRHMVWEGDTFLACAGPPFDQGTEVKLAGDYIWIPRDVFEVLDSPSEV